MTHQSNRHRWIRSWLLLATFLLPGLVKAQSQETLITYQGQDLFASGANVAWVRFAADIGPGTTDLATFESIFRQVRDNGGNSMRLWLHTNGANTPEWSGDRVVGPGVGAITDLKAILDLAESYDVGLMLTLWSFDMVRASFGTTIVDRSYGILTNPDRRAEYIQNALIPMVDALKDHPAILAWEIFNEPEGMSREFGWTDIINSSRLVPMSAIQAFVNQTTGAIKRTDPDVMVTNGAWAFYSNSDIFTSNANYRNYYRDDRLIAAGGDPDGVLDFYTVHYYTWGGTTISPFHHDASYWQLDKPVAMTEFYLQDTFGVSPSVMYQTLYEGGYAGAMGWQWFGQGSNWTNSLANMASMDRLYPDAVALTFDGTPAPAFNASFSASPSGIELGGASTLSWATEGAVSATLDGQAVALQGSRSVSPGQTTTYTLRAAAADGRTLSRSATVTVQLPPPPPLGENLALGAATTATSVEGGLTQFSAGMATDGNPGTRWSSEYADNQILTVDLGGYARIAQVNVAWEAAYAATYAIEVSLDGQAWTTAASVSGGNGGLDEFRLVSPVEARYVRMNGIQRATSWGMSIWEFGVYGERFELPALTAELKASSTDLHEGESVTLSWTTQSATTASLDGEPVALQGSRTVTPDQSATTYTLLVGDAYGRSASSSVTVSVTALEADLSVSPSTIDEGQSATLSWSTIGASSVSINGQTVAAGGSMTVAPTASTIYMLSAVNRAGRTVTREASLSVIPLPPPPVETNLALGKPVTATSVELDLPQFAATMANDGDMSTRWSSGYADGQQLTIDLQGTYLLSKAVLAWEVAHASVYSIEVSLDGTRWTTAFSQPAGDGGIDTIAFAAGTGARYVRVNGITRATQWGVSLYEVEVYGEAYTPEPPAEVRNVAIGKPTTATSVESNRSRFVASNATDGDLSTRWSSAYADRQILTVDLGSAHAIERFVLRWERAYPGTYAVEISGDGSTWTRVHYTTTGDGGVDEIKLGSAVQARYVRMNGITRATRWGMSLWEFEVYGYPIAAKGVTGGATGSAEGNTSVEPSAAQAELNPELPENTELLPNYPNPFNPATTIAYRLAVSSEVLLQVYDLNGRLVATLQQGMRQAGEHRAEFDGSNLASGTYIVRLQADGLQLTRMMTLLK